MNTRTLIGCLALIAVVALQGGCKSDGDATTQADASMGAMSLCGSCGEIYGSDVCCDPDAETCACGLHKGSPGCCKMEKVPGQTVSLCACGEIKGSDACCDGDSEKCASCGMIEGSPGCCADAK